MLNYHELLLIICINDYHAFRLFQGLSQVSWPLAQSRQALVSNNHDRAAPKGLGAVKAAGNYAADIAPVHSAHAEGYNTTLYLDAKERKFIEEFSVCNFVGITKARPGARVNYLI